jgi:hypothetical protein
MITFAPLHSDNSTHAHGSSAARRAASPPLHHAVTLSGAVLT